jgi:hypothetical protein
MAEESPDQGDTKTTKNEESSTEEDETIDEEEEDGGDSGASVAEDDEDDEDEEPKLKYARLTTQLPGIYRNADATSAFLVAGDKMVCS